jgi:hypothetical protein
MSQLLDLVLENGISLVPAGRREAAATLQSFCFQIIIKKMRSPFEMSPFHGVSSGEMEMHRRRRNLQELSDPSSEPKAMVQLPRLAEFEHRYLQRGLAGARSVNQIGTM